MQSYDPSNFLTSPREKGNSDQNFKPTFLLHTIIINSYNIIIIIITIITIITLMQGIYSYIPEKSQLSRVLVAGIYVMPFPMINVLRFYITISRIMCSVLIVVVFLLFHVVVLARYVAKLYSD